MSDLSDLGDAFDAMPAESRAGSISGAAANRNDFAESGDTAQAAFWSALMCLLCGFEDRRRSAFNDIERAERALELEELETRRVLKTESDELDPFPPMPPYDPAKPDYPDE